MTPYFSSFSEFFSMDGDGIFVWTCWGITLFVMAALILYSRHQRKQLLKQIVLQQVRQTQRQKSRL